MRLPAKSPITLSSGIQTEAQTPHIISASRATDIPAFYAGLNAEKRSKKDDCQLIEC